MIVCACRKWIDLQTRAIIFEFNLYNANVDLVTCVVVAIE